MKRYVIVSIVLTAALTLVSKAGVSPPQSTYPNPSTSEIEEPALPMPEAGPSNPEPVLLPESGELPARPPAEAPKKLPSNRASSGHELPKGERFDEIRSLAMTSPRAVYLLKRARRSSNPASRRTYLRAYYITVASRMRKLDPELKSSIDAYEVSKIHEVSGARTTIARASAHRSRLHKMASQQGHRKIHRVSYRNRYRRWIIIDDPYGPDFPPYYGAPVVFYPW